VKQRFFFWYNQIMTLSLTDMWLIWYGLLGLFTLFLFYRYVKSKPYQPIVTTYKPPEKINPMMCGFLVDKKLHVQDMVAGIIFLHEKGVIQFDKSSPRKTVVDEKDIKKVEPYIAELAFERGYFTHGKSAWVILLYLIILGAFVFAGFELFFETLENIEVSSWFDRYAYFIGFIPFGFATSYIIKLAEQTYTEKGLRLRDQISGFQEYLNIAEKNRLDFHNSVQEQPELFTYYLAYAVALGTNTTWLEEYKSIGIRITDTFVVDIIDALPRVVHQGKQQSLIQIIDLVEKHS